ncbi:MAG: glycosyltransferase family 2 protein [Alphaproteobacteria bacterium]
MKKSLISVIVPITNVKTCLSKCLKSITNQTYKNLEIIIIDNVKEKSLKEIYKKFASTDKRIKIITTKSQNINNLALSHATGDFIHFIASCDYISPSYYEKMLTLAKENKSDLAISGFKTTRTKLCYTKNQIAHSIKEKVTTTKINKYDYIFRYFINRNFLLANNIKFQTNSMQDMLFLMQAIFFANNIATVPIVTYFTNLPLKE